MIAIIRQWAARHGVSPQAVSELMGVLGEPADVQGDIKEGRTEAAGQQEIRLGASLCGARLWRNNVGASVDDNGNFIRYGLANESKAMNEVVKSSDLIGITPKQITLDDIGSTLGVFTAIECKRADWVFKGDKHEKAQLAFINAVRAMGGIGQFARGIDDVVIFGNNDQNQKP